MSKVSQYVSERIQKRLAQGRVPWFETMGSEQIEPHSYSSGKPYQGTTLLLAANRMMDKGINGYGFISDYGYKKSKQLNPSIKLASGISLPTMITHWSPREISIPKEEQTEIENDIRNADESESSKESEEVKENEQEEIETKTIFDLRYHYVYNSAQLLNYKKLEEFNESLIQKHDQRRGFPDAEDLLMKNEVCKVVEIDTDTITYDAAQNVLNIPENAERSEEFYYNAFRELGLAASDKIGYDTKDNFKTEVIQDMTAWVLMNRCCLMNGMSFADYEVDQYIDQLNERMDEDTRFMVSCSSRSKKCVNTITDGLFMSPDKRMEETPTGQLVDPDKESIQVAQAKELTKIPTLPMFIAPKVAEKMGMEEMLEKKIEKMPKEKQQLVTEEAREKFRGIYIGRIEETLEKVNECMISGNVEQLGSVLHSPKNAALRESFEEFTGLRLGSTKEEIVETLEGVEVEESEVEEEGISLS